MSQQVKVGSAYLDPLPITVGREPEVGIAWEANCDALGLAALGSTPGEAVALLGRTLQEKGLVKTIDVNETLVNALVTEADDA